MIGILTDNLYTLWKGKHLLNCPIIVYRGYYATLMNDAMQMNKIETFLRDTIIITKLKILLIKVGVMKAVKII